MKARILCALLAGAAIPLLANAADERAQLLREMARSDGNPQGDNAIPLPAKSEVWKLSREQVAFFRQLDGDIAAELLDEPQEAVASR